MSNTDTHYSTEAGGDVKAFIAHFRRQAEGKENPIIINNRRSVTCVRNSRAVKSGLILVDISKENGNSGKGNDGPRVELIDLSEGTRRRAMGEIVREQTEMSNVTDNFKESHSSPSNRKRKTSSKKNQQIQQSVNKKVKRVKDIFD